MCFGLTWHSMKLARTGTQEYLDHVVSATRGPHTKMSSLRLLHDLKLLRKIDSAACVCVCSGCRDCLIRGEGIPSRIRER